MRKAAAGWYADAPGSGSERWFDGAEWTDRTRARRGPVLEPRLPGREDGGGDAAQHRCAQADADEPRRQVDQVAGQREHEGDRAQHEADDETPGRHRVVSSAVPRLPAVVLHPHSVPRPRPDLALGTTSQRRGNLPRPRCV